MKIGSIGFATYQGLGVLLRDFYDHQVVTSVATVPHGSYPNYPWYKEGPRVEPKQLNKPEIKEWAKEQDLLLFFETPFLPWIQKFCRKEGVKTVLVPMYECTPRWCMEQGFDLIISPSKLDRQYYPGSQYLPIPVPDWVTWKQRGLIETFVHNAGHGGLLGRNGTESLLIALEYVKSPIKLILRTQDGRIPPCGPNVDVRVGTFPQEQLYSEGEVFIFPEKFNGLSLPLQEAYASGMVVMATDRFPNNAYLPKDPLIPVRRELPMKVINDVSSAVVDPKTIGKCVDTWYGKDPSTLSLQGKQYREDHSWEVLKPKWLNVLGGLL